MNDETKVTVYELRPEGPEDDVVVIEIHYRITADWRAIAVCVLTVIAGVLKFMPH